MGYTIFQYDGVDVRVAFGIENAGLEDTILPDLVDGDQMGQRIGGAVHTMNQHSCVFFRISQNSDLLTGGVIQVDNKFFHNDFSFIFLAFCWGCKELRRSHR